MKLDAIASEDIVHLEIETGVPIAYALARDGAVLDKKVFWREA